MTRDNLYMLRCKEKLTKGEMATKTGVCRTTYTLIENGKRDGSMAFWNALKREFKIPDTKIYAFMRTKEKE